MIFLNIGIQKEETSPTHHTSTLSAMNMKLLPPYLTEIHHMSGAWMEAVTPEALRRWK